jgi:hypothetical protein
VLLAGLLSACARPWARTKPSHPLPQQISIYVAISDEVAASNDGGSIAALVEALDDDLRERGYQPVIIAAHPAEKPPLPRIELQVLSADWGSRGMRGAGNLAGMAAAPAGVVAVAASGSLVVDCYVVQADSSVTFNRRYQASTLFTDHDGYDTAGAERTGRSIAMAVSSR